MHKVVAYYRGGFGVREYTETIETEDQAIADDWYKDRIKNSGFALIVHTLDGKLIAHYDPKRDPSRP